MPRRIRRRLVLSLLAVAAVPLLGIGLYAIRTSTAALERLALSAARDRIALKGRRVEELLGDLRGDIVFLARSPVLLSLLEGDPTGAERMARQFLSFTTSKPMFASLTFLDEVGDEVVRVRHDGQRSWPVQGDQLRRRALDPAFRAAMQQAPGEVYVEALQRDAGEAREPVVRYAVGVADAEGRRRGVLVADLLARRVVATVRDDGSTTWLLDEAGWTVSPAALPPPHSQPEALAAIRADLGAAGTVVERIGDGRVTWTVVHPAPGGTPVWLLAERVPEAAALASVRRFRWVFAGLVVAVVAVAAALSLTLSARIARPLDALADGARQLAGGDLAHRLDVRTGDEIEQLAAEFNRMGAALQASYEQLAQREADKSERLEAVSRQLVESERLAAVGQLAAGVAHEVNNPVGVMSMVVQQLLEDEASLTPQQADKLRTLERHAERLARITRGLLDFARARDYRRDRLDAAEPVRRALEALAPQLEAAGVAATLEVTEGIEIVGDGETLQQVFENLIVNATHAAPGGNVWLAVTREPGAAVITVRDDGEGIAAEHVEHVFEPFFTTKEVGQGTGLGLAISYGIVQAHRGSMTAASAAAGGAEFTVRLPATGDDDRSTT